MTACRRQCREWITDLVVWKCFRRASDGRQHASRDTVRQHILCAPLKEVDAAVCHSEAMRSGRTPLSGKRNRRSVEHRKGDGCTRKSAKLTKGEQRMAAA